MLLLVIGLTWCVSSVIGYIPNWSPTCVQQAKNPNACIYGNLTVTLFSKTMKPKDCNSQINVNEFLHTPVVHINSTNTTDRFTVVMIDLGPEGKGPMFLEWMVTNVSVTSLPNFQNIPLNDVIANYNPPLLMEGVNHRTLIQILVFRHHNVLRVPFGELWVKKPRNFSFSTLFANTYPNLRLCGPVAGTQYWLFDSKYTPSAPPAPPQQTLQPLAPVYVPMVPIVPVAQVPISAPAPGTVPATHAPAPGQHQHPHTTFQKKSSATVSQPLQILFIPLIILAVMCL